MITLGDSIEPPVSRVNWIIAERNLKNAGKKLVNFKSNFASSNYFNPEKWEWIGQNFQLHRLSYHRSIATLQHPSTNPLSDHGNVAEPFETNHLSWKNTLNIFMRQMNLWILTQLNYLRGPSIPDSLEEAYWGSHENGERIRKTGTII